MASALDQFTWNATRRVLGLNVWGEQLLYRLKARGLNLFVRSENRIACPHSTCVNTEATLEHVFWSCPAAHKRWTRFTQTWVQLGLEADINDPATVLNPTLGIIPTGIFEFIEQTVTWHSRELKDEMIKHAPLAAQLCWRLGFISVLQVIWKWRCEYMEAEPATSTIRFEAILIARLHYNYRNIEAHYSEHTSKAVRRAATSVVNALITRHNNASHAVIPRHTTHVLLFDGGSRGNPGPGGSGSVILRLETGATVVTTIWCASMAFGNASTTNNVADYQGLLAGLKHVVGAKLPQLHVIGDIKMIITQMQSRRPPRAPHLQRLYWNCRRLADLSSVQSWTHHFRSHNKTADALANLAMDTHASRQITAPDTGPLPIGV